MLLKSAAYGHSLLEPHPGYGFATVGCVLVLPVVVVVVPLGVVTVTTALCLINVPAGVSTYQYPPFKLMSCPLAWPGPLSPKKV